VTPEEFAKEVLKIVGDRQCKWTISASGSQYGVFEQDYAVRLISDDGPVGPWIQAKQPLEVLYALRRWLEKEEQCKKK
jgi:hypothetical protein